MFVQNLNKTQQSALLFLAREIMSADNIMHENEETFTSILRSQVEDNVSEKIVPLDELAMIFDTERAKYSLLLELIAIAKADDEYHEKEKHLIESYSNALSVSKDKLKQLENWVSKQLTLSKEAEKLLN